MPKMKPFTLEKAHKLLPVLKSLLKRSMDGKQVIDRAEKEFQDLRHRILLSGGLSVDVAAMARRRAERDKIFQDTKDAIAEINAIGVQVKDLDIGLLDFPCALDDQVVLLCWKYGEDKIEFWHGQEAGFKGRKPIDHPTLPSQTTEQPT